MLAGRIHVVKVRGEENLADLMTKKLSWPEIIKRLGSMYLRASGVFGGSIEESREESAVERDHWIRACCDLAGIVR